MQNQLLLEPEDFDDAGKAVYCYYVEIIPPGGGLLRMALPDDEDVIIGRSPRQCRLLLEDVLVSRVHLKVSRPLGQQVRVTDLYSANGAKLDGRRLQPGMPMTWLINQPIVIGRTHLILRYGLFEE